jgi:hypothetical protein
MPGEASIKKPTAKSVIGLREGAIKSKSRRAVLRSAARQAVGLRLLCLQTARFALRTPIRRGRKRYPGPCENPLLIGAGQVPCSQLQTRLLGGQASRKAFVPLSIVHVRQIATWTDSKNSFARRRGHATWLSWDVISCSQSSTRRPAHWLLPLNGVGGGLLPLSTAPSRLQVGSKNKPA